MALTSVNIGKVQTMRAYEPQYQRNITFPAWQAARAIGTASTILKQVSIDPGHGMKRDCMDAGFHANNPMRNSMEEARECNGDNRRVRCTLGTGTGYPGVIGLSEKTHTRV